MPLTHNRIPLFQRRYLFKYLGYTVYITACGALSWRFYQYKQTQRRKRILTEDEKIAVKYFEQKIHEQRWREHIKTIGREY